MTRFALFLPLLLLPACSTKAPDLRVPVPEVPAAEHVGIHFASIEVRDITLPSYAALEQIHVEAADGRLSPVGGLIWADDPVRGSSLELVRALSQITGAMVAGEPWPFDAYPAARVEVRLEEFVASRRGAFRISGQYFVAALDGSGRDSAHLFSIEVPLAEDAGAEQIAAARAQAVAQLAAQIAREGL